MTIKIPVIDPELVAKAHAPDADWIINILPGWDRSKPFTTDLLPNVAHEYLAALYMCWQPVPYRPLGAWEVRKILQGDSSWPGLPLAPMLSAYADALVTATGLPASVWGPIVLAAFGKAIGVPLSLCSVRTEYK